MPFGPGGGGSGGGGGAVTFTGVINTPIDAEVDITISLAPAGVGLVNGSARASLAIANANNRQAAMIYLQLRSGAVAPTVGSVYEIYLLQRNTGATIGTDGWAGTDATITILNATLIGTITLTANLNTDFRGIFSTPRDLPLGASWGIAIRNASGQSMNGTEANHLKIRAMYSPTINT